MQEFLGKVDQAAVRLMSGFGGGIGGTGSVCGAIIGAVAALSMRYGRGAAQEREDRRLFPLSAEVYRRFGTEIETSHLCRDITGVDFADPAQVQAFRASPEKTGRCMRLVARTAELVCEMLTREGVAKERRG